MPLPDNHPSPPIRPFTLAQAAAQSRHPRHRAADRLLPHRDELLRLRRDGESVETLAAGLHLIGIEIGRETLRRWLQQELKRKPIKRRKTKSAAAPVAEEGEMRPRSPGSLTEGMPISPP